MQQVSLNSNDASLIMVLRRSNVNFTSGLNRKKFALGPDAAAHTDVLLICKLAFPALVYLNTPYLRLSRHKLRAPCSVARCFSKKYTNIVNALMECIYIQTGQTPTPHRSKSHLINYLFQKPPINWGCFCDFDAFDENSPSFFRKMLAIRCTATNSSEPNMQPIHLTYTQPFPLFHLDYQCTENSHAPLISGGML